ncbi:serine/threonine-protein kinase NIM1 [Hemitrygon akajei]|uniref:serine/threonine-protein kinase NIM1 n=1 Tax=Hemitrygon akajei TaxID=2704970 RepID=UPI003BFA2558
MTAVYAIGTSVVSHRYAGWPEDRPRPEEKGDGELRRLTPLELLSHQMAHDEQTVREVTLGKRIGFYRLRGQIGAGNFSRVKLAIHSLTREKVAIKILDKTRLDQKTQRLLSREIASMERLHHPNIIRLYEVIETLSRLHLVMEYAGGGELFTKISTEGRLPEADSKAIFAQIVSAVKHMHDQGTVHRDLKAENIFYAESGRVKVGDFGFSTACQREQSLRTFCGSPPYAAPELFRDESYAGPSVDVWALGVLLYYMVAGTLPFRADTVARLKRCILAGAFAEPAYLSEACLRLIRAILRPEPSQRQTPAQILASEWMKGTRSPRPLRPFPLEPGHLAGTGLGPRPLLEPEQAEVKQTLASLGVTDSQLRESQGRGPRSPLTGTYRIVLHRVQRRQGLELAAAMGPDPEPDLDPPQTEEPGKGQVKFSTAARHTSRFCSIL